MVTSAPRRRSGEPPIRVLDLFAGAGGLTQGFREASSRFRTIRAVEFDAAAAATYAANHGDNVVYSGSIQDWLAEEVVPDVDVIVGGPPCQGFSTLGRQDAEDERNGLWRQYAETIVRARPKYFVVENVATFLKSSQYSEFCAETSPGGLLDDYDLSAKVLNAADFGAAQARRRAVVVGRRRDVKALDFPRPSHARDAWVPLKEVLQDLPEQVHATALPVRTTFAGDRAVPGPFLTRELHVGRKYEEISRRRFRAIPEGGNRFDLPFNLQAPCWRSHKTGSADVMGRLRWDRPSVTIRTEFFKPEKGRYIHPTEPRAITHHEAARIQGFPDDYLWVGTKVAIARQIGNAVPIPLGSAIAHMLIEALSAIDR